MLNTLTVYLLLTGALLAQVSLHEIQVQTPGQALALASLGLDVVEEDPSAKVLIWNVAELTALTQAGFSPVLVHADMEAFYASRLTQSLTPEGAVPGIGQGSMGGYYTYAEMILAMDSLQSQYPTLVAPKISLGLTLEGRDIWMWKISDNPTVDESEPEVLIDGVHHAREVITVKSAVYLTQMLCQGYGQNAIYTSLVDNREIFIVPIVNVDGYVFNEISNPGGGGLWRKTRRDNLDGTFGVDPNRNYGWQWGYDNVGSSATTSSQTYRGTAPFSELCTLVMKTFAESRSFQLGLSMHSYGQMLFIPPGYEANTYPPQPLQSHYEGIAQEAQTTIPPHYAAGYLPDILYKANGTTTDWWYGALYGGLQMWSFGCEIGSAADGFWPPTANIQPLVDEFLPYQIFMLKKASADPQILDPIILESGGMTTGVWEPGETLSVTVATENRGTLSGAVTLTAETADPYLTVTGGPVSLGSLTIFGSANNNASPFQVSISQSTPAGILVSFDLVATSPMAVESRITVSRVINMAPMVVVSDEFESASGWTGGIPGDTALLGVWTQQDPNGTSQQGQPFNPEDDHTPGGGTDCWFTGQGTVGGSVGSEDVDGTTTLLSPLYDLTNLSQAKVSYWRWFNTSGSDTLEVAVSNDAGDTWMELETVTGAQNSWTQVTFDLDPLLFRTNRMQFLFRAADEPNNSICEAAIDSFVIDGFESTLSLTDSGLAAAGSTLSLDLSAPFFPGTAYFVGASATANNGIPTPWGTVPLDVDFLFNLVPQFPLNFVDFSGTLDGTGIGQASFVIPPVAGLSGFGFHTAAVIIDGGIIRGITGARHFTLP